MFNPYDLFIAQEKAERLYTARSIAFMLEMEANENGYYDSLNDENKDNHSDK